MIARSPFPLFFPYYALAHVIQVVCLGYTEDSCMDSAQLSDLSAITIQHNDVGEHIYTRAE